MITPILEFLAFGSLGFWILCSIVSAVFIACIEHENHWFPSCLVVIFAAVYWKAIAAFSLNWQSILLGVAVYAVLGVAWSMFRWTRFVKEKADYYRKQYGTKLDKSNRSCLASAIDATSNKSRITGWIAYWPWSLIWNLTGDVFKMLYETLQGVYQKISDRAVGKFDVDNN